MVFKIGSHISRLFMCLCILLSCNEGHKSSNDIHIVWATDYSEEGLDFLCDKDTTYIYPDNTLVLKNGKKFYALSDHEFSLAKDILKHFFNNYLYEIDGNTSEQPFRLRKYFRQYLGYMEKDSPYVYVNIFTHFPTISDPECLCTFGPSQRILIYEKNGGHNYGTVIINLSKMKVVFFELSKTDPTYTIGHYTEKNLRLFFPSK